MGGAAGNDSVTADSVVNATQVGSNQQGVPPIVNIAIAMQGGGGNDNVTARMGVEPTPIQPEVNVNLTMDGGAGDDRIDLNLDGQKVKSAIIGIDSGAGNDVVDHILSGDFQDPMLDVNTGAGDDVLYTLLSEVKFAHGSALYFTSRGNDHVLMERTDNHLAIPLALTTGDGNDTVVGRVDQFSDVPLGVFVDLGNGSDTAFLTFEMKLPSMFDEDTQFVASMNIQVLGGTGDDTISVRTMVMAPVFRDFFGQTHYMPGAQFRLDLLVDGGRGNDVLNVRGEYASPVGDGPGEFPRFRGEVHVNVLGSSDTDYLNVLWEDRANVQLTAIADGGPGVDTAITSPNVTVVNCEF